jgi:hypothetical protein
MARLRMDDLHSHRTWGPILRPEFVEMGRLHRHRLDDALSVPKFTTWERNTRTHRHRLPDGAWSRPRLDLRASEDNAPAPVSQPKVSTGHKRREQTAQPHGSPSAGPAGYSTPAD